MRKDALQEMVANKLQADATDMYASNVNTILQSLPFAGINPDDNISFEMLRPHLPPALITNGFQTIATTKKHDDERLKFFITGKIALTELASPKPIAPARTGTIISKQAQTNFLYREFLDAKSSAILSATCSTFYNHSYNYSVWRKKLESLPIHRKALNYLVQNKAFQNYKNVYRALHDCAGLAKMQLWELCCASGEVSAIQFAIEQLGLTKDTSGYDTPMQYAAGSSSVAAMSYLHQRFDFSDDEIDFGILLRATSAKSIPCIEFAIRTLGISANIADFMGNVVNQLARDIGCLAETKYAIEKLGIPHLTPRDEGITVLDDALLSGCIEKIRYLHGLGITLSPDEAMSFAACSGSKAAMEFVHSILNKENYDDEHSTRFPGMNPLQLATKRGDVPAMEYAIDVLGIGIDKTLISSQSLVLYAFESASLPAMKYVVETLELNPLTLDNTGMNGLLIAAKNGDVAGMKYAIAKGIPANSTSNQGNNAWIYAAQSGVVAAMQYAIEIGNSAHSVAALFQSNGLHLAAKAGAVDAMAYAISLGIPFDSVDDAKQNILFYAAESTVLEAMEYAIQLGIDVNHKNDLEQDVLAHIVTTKADSIPVIYFLRLHGLEYTANANATVNVTGDLKTALSLPLDEVRRITKGIYEPEAPRPQLSNH